MKESTGLLRTDGKRPDGVSLVPGQSGKSICWDVTVTCPLGESYIDRASHEAGTAAEMAASRKEDKYVDLGARYIFERIAVETLGIFSASARHLLADLGRRNSINTGEARETSYGIYFTGLLLNICIISKSLSFYCANFVCKWKIRFLHHCGVYRHDL